MIRNLCLSCNKEISDNTKNHSRIYCNNHCQYMNHKQETINRAKQWKIDNPEKLKEYSKRYRIKHKEHIKQSEKIRRQLPEVKKKLLDNSIRHYWKYRDKILNRMKLYRKYNSKIFNNWRKNNKLKKRIYEREKLRNDIQYCIRHRLRNRLYYALKFYTSTGKIRTSKEYGLNYKSIIEYLKPFPMDIKKYHIDHIIPLVSFDLTNSEEIKKAFAPENHQWLLAKDNLIKNKKIYI